MTSGLPWQLLRDRTQAHNEAELQQIMGCWNADRCGWHIIAPTWLLAIENPTAGVSYPGYDCRFVPDIVVTGKETMVLELKRAPKGEEIALAEVLHQAWALSEKNAVPVIICSYSPWLRAALTYLFGKGLPRSAIRYLEVSWLEREDEGTSGGDLPSRILWFDEPFSKWVFTEDEPPCRPAATFAGMVAWHRAEESGTWIGIEAGKQYERPETPYPGTYVAPIDRMPNTYAAWASDASQGTYHLCLTDG
jgi:hypothetical protein